MEQEQTKGNTEQMKELTKAVQSQLGSFCMQIIEKDLLIEKLQKENLSLKDKLLVSQNS